jgi:outer membrane protein, multidrug efflux system
MKKCPAILIAFLLSGCSLTPDYQRPVTDTPSQWSAETALPGTVIAKDWWKNFDSDELNILMDLALANNNDLMAGIQRIEQSRVRVRIAGASLLPAADGSAGVGQSRTNPGEGGTTNGTNLDAGLNVSYELDLFGKNNAGVNSAQAGLKATEYDQEALALVVMGDVANGYFTLLNLRERLAVADQNLENAREVLRIIQARVREGMESDIELAQQETSVSSAEATRASLVQQIANQENALAVLLGKAPKNIVMVGNSLADLSIPEIVAEQPSSLLQRRPDIAAAEQDLIAANADIGAARAAFFPSITLGLGTSVSLPGFGDPATTALSLASSLAAPIFQSGRLEGGVEQATARQKELVETYKKTVLVSFQEVEDALSAVKAAREREVSLSNAAVNARKAYDLSKRRYDAGSIDFRTLLDTQSSLLSVEDTYAQAKLARLNAAIDLYKALGGGWSS